MTDYMCIRQTTGYCMATSNKQRRESPRQRLLNQKPTKTPSEFSDFQTLAGNLLQHPFVQPVPAPVSVSVSVWLGQPSALGTALFAPEYSTARRKTRQRWSAHEHSWQSPHSSTGAFGWTHDPLTSAPPSTNDTYLLN